MRPITTYDVVPNIPNSLSRLLEIAYNIRWAWDHEAIALFQRIDPELWEETEHNPIRMLGMISQERMDVLSQDDGFVAHYERVLNLHDTYLSANGKTWYSQTYSPEIAPVIAYFSFEFGLTESIPNYSGGLGVLAGDHLKAASDLNVPLTGIGLLYQQGYFRQYLNVDGWQQERYPVNDFYTMPLTLVKNADGEPIVISIELAGDMAYAQIWKVQVGRIDLYLLDTNIPVNSPEIQELTDQLYGGDREMRIKQEILLGIGGLRALHALGLEPAVCHMNEGHSAFLSLERARILMERYGMSFYEAFALLAPSNVFTTHTPVPAGNDYFSPDLVAKYFETYWTNLGLSEKEFFALGRFDPENDEEYLCMTILALNASAFSNGVSKLHGAVAREMWQDVYEGVPNKEVPIGSITNGVHTFSWLSGDLSTLLDRYLGLRWREDPTDVDIWKRTHTIPDEELWRTHERRRLRLVSFARQRLVKQLENRGAPPADIEAAHEALDPEVLTIGFARRFATYKRATLLFQDKERLLKLLNSDRPVQFVFAGKAHPHDTHGKEFIRQIIHFTQENNCHDRIVFIEDYDMVVGRYLTQGVDVWLNTPQRPNEASGTSGMKAAMNGILNLSILDGWWDEAYALNVGWAIGSGEIYEEDVELQDYIEANAVYDLIEHSLVPAFYNRDTNDLPRDWIVKMKACISELSPIFNTARMVQEYTSKYYYPALNHYRRLSEKDFSAGREFSTWIANLQEHWSSISIQDVDVSLNNGDVKAGSSVQVSSQIYLGNIYPDHIAVQLYEGQVDKEGEIEGQTHIMQLSEKESKGKGWYTYTGEYVPENTGRNGCTLRVVPHHSDMGILLRYGLITWAE